ncbi:MAG: glycosyltransferase family 2 protein [Deltaproteobacteria bacterium]|nr:glycosyltransferase family 2 protein [Deltaproteobacteria bacterium]
MKLSVIIPCHNEAGCVEETIRCLYSALKDVQISHEIVAINDNSTDDTVKNLLALKEFIPTLKLFHNLGPAGFGLAVRTGLDAHQGQVIAIYMADASDSPKDLVHCYQTLMDRNVDCVFGSRFIRGSHVSNYPWHKLILNRLANLFIRFLFGLHSNDITNAFKLYRSHVIEGVRPFLSHHFNLTVELPLKAIVRGYTYAVIPISWSNRKTGVSKLRIKEMGSRYLFIVLYCLLEKWLSRGDYRKKD